MKKKQIANSNYDVILKIFNAIFVISIKMASLTSFKRLPYEYQNTNKVQDSSRIPFWKNSGTNSRKGTKYGLGFAESNNVWV